MSQNEDASLPPIPPKSAVIWRYLDFTQLVSILEREALWFNRADLFNDPLEGSHSRATVNTRKERYQGTEIPQERIDSLITKLSGMARVHRNSSYVNCWHLNERESMAMWELYSLEGQGIAIQSDVGMLKESLRETGGYINGEDTPVPEEAPRMKIFTLGAVQYIDYDEHFTPEGNFNAPLFHKRLSYKHEQEFRVVNSRFSELIFEHTPQEIAQMTLAPGEYMETKLDNLINKIHVSPSSADWFFELVERVVEKYGLSSIDVVRSSLDAKPVF